MTDLVAACDRWLDNRHVTLWGYLHTITDETDRLQAAEWLATQIRGVRAEQGLT